MTIARNDTRVTLGGRHAHLWWIRPDTLTDPAELARCRALLTDDDESTSIPEQFQSLDRHEREYIEWVLAQCDGNISQAARRLGLHRQSLQRKLRKYTPTH